MIGTSATTLWAVTRQRIDVALLSVACFLCTLGPVYTLRVEVGPFTGPWVEDSFVRGVFGVLYLICAVALFARPWRWDRGDAARIAVPVTLVALALVSTTWSAIPTVTWWRAVQFGGTTLVGVYLATQLTPLLQAGVIAVSQTAGVLLSLLRGVVDRPRAIEMTEGTEALAGIYFNRNSLGPVAGLALVATVALALGVRPGWPRGVLAGFAVLDVVALWWCRSLTSIAATLAGLAALGALHLLRRTGGSPRSWAAVSMSAVTAGALAALAWRPLAAATGKSPTLSSRTPLWDYTVELIGLRRFRGWGFATFWEDPAFLVQTRARIEWLPPTAHNGFLETALGIGIPAAVLLAGGIAVAWWRTGTDALADPEPWRAWMPAALAFAVVANLTESFVLANQVLWVVIVAAMAQRPLHPVRGHDHDQVEVLAVAR